MNSIFLSPILGLFGGVVAWLFSAWMDMDQSRLQWAIFEVDRNKAKLEIIDLIKDREATLALSLIDYYDDKYSETDPAYDTLLDSLSQYINSAQTSLTTPDSAITTSVALVRQEFNSANRRKYSESLVATYESDPTARDNIVRSLLGAIVLTDDEDVSRYRVNIYIALTFSLLPKGAIVAEDQKLALKGLAGMFESDKTFQLNVQNALSRQGIA